MKHCVIFCLMALSAARFAVADDSLSALSERLGRVEEYGCDATYSVLLPSATDDIVYRLDIQSKKNVNDRLSPCSYLVDWTLDSPSGRVSGFESYGSGAHFRYRDNRLQEYYFEWDSIPFVAADGGVQRHAQFYDILPQPLSAQLKAIATDSAYSYTLMPSTCDGRDALTVEAEETRRGYTARKLTLQFDSATALPLRLEYENNPGQISEQTITVEFGEQRQLTDGFDEESIAERYPQVFEKYRRSNFRVENLPGTPLPTFSLPTTTGERYTYHKGDTFKAPTVIALLDSSVGTATETVEAVRKAVGQMPFAADVVWVFQGNNVDAIEAVVGSAREDEALLMSGRALARDCGVTAFPTLLFVARDGVVSASQLGFNNSLLQVVIEKLMLANR